MSSYIPTFPNPAPFAERVVTCLQSEDGIDQATWELLLDMVEALEGQEVRKALASAPDACDGFFYIFVPDDDELADEEDEGLNYVSAHEDDGGHA